MLKNKERYQEYLPFFYGFFTKAITLLDKAELKCLSYFMNCNLSIHLFNSNMQNHFSLR
jgi:hypothetical protein